MSNEYEEAWVYRYLLHCTPLTFTHSCIMHHAYSNMNTNYVMMHQY